MSATFTTTILGDLLTTNIDGYTDVVKQANFLLTGEESGQTFQLTSTANFDVINPENFIPYNELTQQEVISWINGLGMTKSMQAQIQIVINQMIFSAELTPLPAPWDPAPTPPTTP